MSAYNPSPMAKHTNARAADVNRELEKIKAAFDQLQTALETIIAGPPPDPVFLYTWRAYANSPDGLVDFTTGDPEDRSFIGLAFNKLVETPSLFPEDYEWSPLHGIIGELISIDTTNVAGRPATQVISDLDALALQILAYQFDRQTLTDYVNAKLFVDGVAVNTVIVTESNERQTADSALAETIGLIGAKTLDGTAFIVDLDKTYVDPTTSFAVRLSAMQAETATAQATADTVTQLVASGSFATAQDLSLLGAKTLDGTGWVLNLTTVKVSPTETLSTYINTAVAAAAGGAASVTEIYEAVITPTGGASAKAVLQLDVNGKVVGYSATNDGEIGVVRFKFDSFIIEDPAGNSLFTASGGLVKMPNVEIDTLKVGSVLSEAIAPNEVTEKLYWAKSWGTPASGAVLGAASEGSWAAFGDTGNKALITTPSLPANSEVCTRLYVNMERTGSNNDRVWFRLMRTDPASVTTQVGDSIKAGMGTFPLLTNYEWTDTPSAAGVYTYAIQYYREEGGGAYHSAKLVLDMGKR